VTVTALLVSCNQIRFLPDALSGLAAQTRRPDQVIIMDDASTDGSVALLRSWIAEHRPDTVFVAHQENRGVIKTLNEAMRLVTCDLVAPLAADDVWLPHKLAVQVPQLEALPSTVGVLYGDVSCLDEDGKRGAPSFITAYKGEPMQPEGDLFEALLLGNFLPSPSLLLRHACWERVGDFDERLYMEDWDFWLRVAREFSFAFTPQEVGHYRVVTGSHVRRTGVVADRAILRMMMKWRREPAMRTPELQDRVRGLSERAYPDARGWDRLRRAWIRHRLLVRA
jgi:glycosyltransferase involved in cell wall biosynthesis